MSDNNSNECRNMFNGYHSLYNNQINVCTLIGQLAMVYCASKLMEKLHVF